MFLLLVDFLELDSPPSRRGVVAAAGGRPPSLGEKNLPRTRIVEDDPKFRFRSLAARRIGVSSDVAFFVSEHRSKEIYRETRIPNLFRIDHITAPRIRRKNYRDNRL